MTPSKNILIIDDDGIFVFTASRTLKRYPEVNQVWSSIHGKDALAFLAKRSCKPEELPDIIMLDIEIPIMDAWEFLEEFRTLRTTLGKKMQIFLTTASISPDYITKAKEFDTEVAGYIVKPISDYDYNMILTKE
jgi:CheY-like chemotaxis protein